ncbi:dnaJ subfamily B member 1-like [Histomonas meleagridis]|uniref:dnaJ-like subfamily B member 1-like n=1 Tax=Histomonas meleagridis TaxID=135588 RepID=UPI00355A98A5|nr:dnaJ subfamily B member 1-like [Histomonas meleagridis]KAH0803202.1 dnaJ-like subfamily B member 1-like [Histomonas meleagridis]
MHTNYYEVLGLPSNASNSDIKKAYYTLALRYHPDKNPYNVEEATKKFELIREAYNTLSNKILRENYDKKNYQITTKVPKGSFSKRSNTFDDLYYHFYGKDDDFAKEVHDGIYGTIRVPVDCTLEELFDGASKIVKFNRYIDGKPNARKAKITLNKGMSNGDVITLQGMGNTKSGHPPCDVEFIIRELKHDVFRREGDNIHLEQTISLLQALRCVEININGIDGEKLEITKTKTIQPESKMTFHGKGMPKAGGERGDLICRFHVELPKSLSEEQKQHLISVFTE